MDLTEIYEFWENFHINALFIALGGLLQVLFEIVHEWRLKETNMSKYMGIGMNPRKAILWHATEFMSDAHRRSIRICLRRELLNTALISVNSSMDVRLARRREEADDERKKLVKETVEQWLQTVAMVKIRNGDWKMPEEKKIVKTRKCKKPDTIDWDWPHWQELRVAAEDFRNSPEVYPLLSGPYPKKAQFLRYMEPIFWNLVMTNKPKMKRYHGSVKFSMANSCDENVIGNTTAVPAASVAEKPEEPGGAAPAEPERNHNLKKVAEAESATDLLTKMEWLHECPDETRHRESFKAIMKFCEEHSRCPSPQHVQYFMQKPDFPSSMRAWSIMPYAALKEAERRRQVPRFLSDPDDTRIRQHANKAPESYQDPGNVNLDLAFYLLCLWEFICPRRRADILKLSWKDYGTRGEKSSRGPINFRGNWLEALIGYCDEKTIEVSGGYHAGRWPKPQQASPLSRQNH